MELPVTLGLAAVILGLTAVAMGYILGWANQAFHVAVDPKVEAINEALPGANCGGCGFVGCGEYAEAVAAGKAPPDLCAPGGPSCIAAIAEVMGVEVGEQLPYRPVMHCAATTEQRLGRHDYKGEQTCAAANLVNGIQGCTYGCLGFGDCYRACNYDAIKMIDGVPEINYDKCVGCKACAKACPRNIITMVPWKGDAMMVIGCSNKDKGLAVKAVCDIGCIGCKACAKKAPGIIKMDDGLPTIDYDAYDPNKFEEIEALDKCPRESMVYVGRPNKEMLDKVEDENLPEVIRAKFKTTVDKTEWWG